MADLTSMQNIGKEIARKLTSIGIDSPEELRRIGSKEAFFRLKIRYSNLCLVHLYALQGAIDGIAYNQLSEEIKRDLKKFGDELK